MVSVRGFSLSFVRRGEIDVNISSFNVTDVGYHYIGLRVVGALPDATRDAQTATISRNVAKYMRDKALRLMLPEPKSSYDTVGEKVCRELVHFDFATAVKGRGYTLTATGIEALGLLNERKHLDLRRLMALVHLKTYTNLRAVVNTHIARGGVLSPIVEATRTIDIAYIASLLRPTFGPDAESVGTIFLDKSKKRSQKQIEDALRELVLNRLMPLNPMSVPLFRAVCDRLVSLRLLNAMRVNRNDAELNWTYSPCVHEAPLKKWHHLQKMQLSTGDTYAIYLSEPNFEDNATLETMLAALDDAFAALREQAGYFDLPEVRDFVCEKMLIPEASFDEGILALMDMPATPITLGLTYERISGRRKPLVRLRESTQLYNLIRRV